MILKRRPNYDSLSYLQEIVRELDIERGHVKTKLQCLAKIGEEYGELCRAVLKDEGIILHEGSGKQDIGAEIADMQKLIAEMANLYEKNLAEEFEKKVIIKDSTKKYLN